MTGFEPMIAGLSALVLNTVTETAKEESGSTLARWLNKDIGKALEQQVYNASGAYLSNYQQRHGTLKVTCVRMDAPMELDKLYTAVRLLERSELYYFESVEGLLSQYRESGRRGFRDEKSQKQDGIAVANQQQFLMVLGGPGIGKSTLLRKVGLEALKRKGGSFAHDCLPVFLPLQRFKDVGISIEKHIVEEFDICGFPEPEAVTAALLKKGRLLVLLDGLDEVSKELEDAVIEQIRDFVDRHSNNRFIASCRVAAYKGGFPRFRDVAIAPFEDEQIEQFIHNWFSAEKDQENNTASQCWELLKRSEYAATKELAQTPLLLTLLCAVYDKQLDFPKNRASLYGEALDVVLKEWAAEKRIHNDPIYRDLPLELERELLAELAFDSFVEDQLFFEKREVTQRIKDFLVNNLNAPKHLDSEAILEAIEVQQGILTKRARDTYSFSHLTFQEYLTAQHIIDNQKVSWLVENYITDEQWREIFLLVAGLLRGRGADSLLQSMEKQVNCFLCEPSLQTLLHWVATATNYSKNPSKPSLKRARAIFLILILAHALSNRNPVRSRIFARDLLLAYNLDHALAPGSNFADDLHFNLNLDFNPHSGFIFIRVFEIDFDLARYIQSSQIFGCFEYDELLEKLVVLKGLSADALPREGFIEMLLEYWSEALQFDLNQLKDIRMILENYLYFYELIMGCKEAAVRVSPEVWQGIEERMLTVSKND